MKKQRILMMNRQASAVAYYRSWVPARILRAMGHEVTAFEDSTYYRGMKPTVEKWMQEHFGQFDIIHTDRAIEWDAAAKSAGFKHYSPGARMIVDFDDDFTNVPWWNTAHGSYQPGQEHREAGIGHLRLAEMTTVSTRVLADTFADKAHAIEVAPNVLDPKDWEGLPANPDRPKDPHLRVLYGGASGHFGDLDDARKGIEAVLDNPPVPFRLICFGAIPFWLHEKERQYPGRVVSLPWVHFMQYPATVAWGGFDIALAPLKEHVFNRAKSNIKWLEAGIQKIPFLCSNVGPYADIPADMAVKVENTPVQWATALRQLLQDADQRRALREAAYAGVREATSFDSARKIWDHVLEKTLARPRIETLADTFLPSQAAPPA